MLDGSRLQVLYRAEIRNIGFSVFTGGETTESTDHFTTLPDTPIIQAFLDDDDIQEIRIASGNIGMVRTYQKTFARIPA